MFLIGQQTSNANYFQFVSDTQIRIKVSGTFYDFTSSTLTIPRDTWGHLIVIKDSSNSLQPYLNGQAFGTAINLGLKSVILDSLGRVVNSSFGFKGFLDEFAIWNTDQTANIATIYGSGIPSDITGLNPLINLRMGENATFDTGTQIWTATSIGSDTRSATSQNMDGSEVTTDVPT